MSFTQIVRPMRTTFATALGSKTNTTSVIVRAVLDDGQVGEGEVPTSFAFKNETAPAIKDVLRQARNKLSGCSIDEYGGFIRQFRKEWPEFRMTISGLEVALFRAWLAKQGVNEHHYWGAKSKLLETDITIPYMRSEEDDMLAGWFGQILESHFKVYKVKVGGDVEYDLQFIRDINNFLNETVKDFTIRLDGNQGYTADSCLKMLDELERARIKIELFEQPVRRDDYVGLRSICSRSAVPIIADETVFSLDDCKRVIEEKLAHGVNIKIAKSGISESAEILRTAKDAGLKVMIGCMTETMVGLSAAIYMAAGTGAFDYIDLDSTHFLNHLCRYGDIIIDGRSYRIETEHG